ncbi:hypothetical protein J4217_00480 [Candidatus Pacearchaeota archaeon]|nr:hypothetical protein [Candidatus Pacearchaeota archaeon]
MNEEILSGLRNAIERGSSLEQAIQSFINAGYNALEVRDAANSLTTGASTLTIDNSIIVNQKQVRSNQSQRPIIQSDNGDTKNPTISQSAQTIQTPVSVPQSQTPFQLEPGTAYIPKKEGHKGKGIVITLVVILIILLALLILSLVFKPQILDFIKNF